MAKWLFHDYTLYNLDQFTQVCLGDPDEILLSTFSHNMDWDDEEEISTLTYPDEESRNVAFQKIKDLLLEKENG